MHEIDEKMPTVHGKMESPRGQIGGRRPIVLLLGPILITIVDLCASTASAQSVTCTGNAETIQITMPRSITVPRNAANGTVLTPWVSSSAITEFFRCTSVAAGRNIPSSGTAFQPLSMTRSSIRVTGPNNTAYTVWNTNVPGIGIAIGVRAYVNVCGWQPWGDLGTTSAWAPPPWQGNACDGRGPLMNGGLINGGQAEMALVKTNTITAGNVTGGVIFEAASATAQSLHASYSIAASNRKKFSLTDTTINVASCSTPNVAVLMGSHKKSSFTGIGSTTPAMPFFMDIHACPAGLNTIRYQFSPINTVLDNINGVLALSNDSTATGIGLQLRDATGIPLKYNTQYTLDSYSTSTGGSYKVPLTAAYYQTSRDVTAGSANAVLTFTMSYQ